MSAVLACLLTYLLTKERERDREKERESCVCVCACWLGG